MKHVSLAFAQLKDGPLLAFGEGVAAAFVANPTVVTDCPVTAVTLGAANTDFSAKLAAMDQGGTTATDEKEASRAALLLLLRQIAAWLEGKAQGDESMMNQLGFQSTEHGPHAQSPLSKPGIKAVLNVATTQLLVRLMAVANAHAYEVQYRINGGAWVGAGSFTDSRQILLTGLAPGTLYEIRVRAIGGSTGYSDWSDSFSHMCT